MGWDIDSITQERLKRLKKHFPEATEDWLVYTAKVEAALYPFATALADLDSSYESTWASSKLFPLRDEKTDHMMYYEDGTSKELENDPPADKLHETDYYLQDSIRLDGYGKTSREKLDDKFEILTVVSSHGPCSILSGSIWMEDVRRAVDIIFPTQEIDPE